MGKFDAKIDQVCKDSQIFKKDLMASINFDIENEQNKEEVGWWMKSCFMDYRQH